MQGICLELRGKCTSCGQPLAINALSTRLRCTGCGGISDLPADAWASVIRDALREAPGLDVGEGSQCTRVTRAGPMQVTHGRIEPRCRSCQAPVSMHEAIESTGDGGTVPCSGCGIPIHVRPMPARMREQVAPHVTHIIGEDADQIAQDEDPPAAPAVSSQPQVLHCPECGGELTVDGGERTTTCMYCQSQVVLPEDLWRKLHPRRQAARWFLWYDEEAAARSVYEGLFQWSLLWDMTADVDGNVFAFGTVQGPRSGEDEVTIWSMAQSRRTRWVHRGLPLADAYHGRLQVTPSGEVLVCHPYKHVLLRLSAEDGRRLGTMGEVEPAGASAPSLDARAARDFAVDRDGTILLYVHQRLLRFDEQGRSLPTWPGRSGLAGLFDRSPRPQYRSPPDPEEPPFADDPCRELAVETSRETASLRNRPSELGRGARITVGHDGCLYVIGGGGVTVSQEDRTYWACKYERSGRQLYRVKLPAREFGSSHASLGADEDGYLFVTCWTGRSERSLLRVSPDGKQTRSIWTDQDPGESRSDLRALAVHPRGELWIAGRDQRLRIIDRDGKPLYSSDAAGSSPAHEKELDPPGADRW